MDNWYCSDNLDANHCACSVPQEMSVLNLATAQAGVSKAAPCQKRVMCMHGRIRTQCKECG